MCVHWIVRLWLTHNLRGRIEHFTSLKEMWCLASLRHDALKIVLKSIEHSIIESNQWAFMGPHE
jgi:hypothetical protein